MPEELTLFPYQLEDREQFLRWKDRKGIYNGNIAGAGKTIETIDWIRQLPGGMRILIICPSSAVGVWYAEFERFLVDKNQFRTVIQIIDSRKQKIQAHANLVICSYEMASPFTPKGADKMEANIASQLVAQDFDLMVVDEAHRLGSYTSTCSRLILGNLYPRIPHSWFLSGSITRNKIHQVWPVWHAIAPEVIPDYKTFLEKFCYYEVQRGRVVIFGAKNKEAAKELGDIGRAHFLIRQPEAVVRKGQPPVMQQKVYLEMPSFEQKRLAEAARDFDIDRELERLDETDDATEDEQFSTMRRGLGRIKAPKIAEYVIDLHEDSGKPVVLFVYHQEVFEEVCRRLDFAELNFSSVRGGDSIGRKTRNVAEFQAGKTDIFVGTYAISEAVTLTRSFYVVLGEMAVSRFMNEQAIARVDRKTQKNPVHVKLLLAAYSELDEKVYNMYKRKKSDHKQAFEA